MSVVVSGSIFRSSKQDLNHCVSIIELRISKGQFVSGMR